MMWDVTEPSVQRRWRTVALVIGTIALAGVTAVLVGIGGLLYLSNEIFDNEQPSCDREPVVLEWTQQGDGLWRRSTPFELLEDSQTVQVDLALANEDAGQVLNFGRTVYVIASGETFAADFEETTSSTQPFEGEVVGNGIDGVNEQVTLGAGKWQLIVKGAASAAEVRWPC